MNFLREGITIAFHCLGSDFEESHQFLAGFGNGDVRLTGTSTEAGTTWIAHETSDPEVFTFECDGTGSLRFLDGRTLECNVGLAATTDAPFIGTRWRVIDLPDQGTHVKLQCQGNLDNSNQNGCPFGFLDGRTAVNDGGVGLQPLNNDFSGTHWELIISTEEPVNTGGGGGGESVGPEGPKPPNHPV
jgi:hypothetical protein